MQLSHKETTNELCLEIASSKSTREALGHKGERTWHAYAAPTIGVDAQAIAYDKLQDTSHAEYSQSIALTRDFAAPKPPRSVMGILPIPSKEILNLVMSAHPKSRREMVIRKARRLQHRTNLAKYSKIVGSIMAPDNDSVPVQERTQDIPVHLHPNLSARFRQMLKYEVLRARVIETLWTAEDASLGDCVKPLMALADPKPFRPFYPDPVLPPKENGRCPYCDVKIDGLRHARLASHLLDCHSYTHHVHLCTQCAIFVGSEEWEDHQCPDLDENRQDYGVTLWRGLVISEGRCPYGTHGYRDKLWYHLGSLNNHIEVHLKKMQEGSQSCPILGCASQIASKDDIRIHFHEVHHIHMVSGRVIMSRDIALPKQT